MILPTMTNQEISRIAENEFRLIQSRYFELKAKEYDKIRRRNKIPKTAIFRKSFEFRTPSKNNWILILGKAPADKKYKGMESITFCSLFYYYTSIGLRVFKIIPTGGLAVYNAHFFSRYNERMNLGISSPLDKVKHFFQCNGFSVGKEIEKDDRIMVFSKCRDGYMLGDYKEPNWIIYKTFIPNNYAWPDQTDEGEALMKSLMNDIHDDLVLPDFNREMYIHKADIYDGINIRK